MPHSWTKNQQKAISTLDVDVCVAAGAGSGKTGVLVERFVRIVRGSRDGTLPPEQRAGVGGILVITFTDKATREMKARIVRALTEAGLEEERRAVETAYISTIHGFCSRLLKENPFEAGVDPAFRVLDETAARRTLHAAFETVIERAYALGDEEVTELVAVAQDERVFGTDARDPLAALEDGMRQVMNRLRGAGWRQEEVQARWREGREATAASARAPVLGLVNDTVKELRACGKALWELKSGVGGTLEALRRELVEGLAALKALDGAVGWARVAETLACVQALATTAGKGTRARANASPAEMRAQELMQRIRSCADTAKGLYELTVEQEERAELLCYRFLGLLAGTWAVYDEAKRAQGALDQEDLQAEAVRLLETSAGVRRRVQSRFRYLMVDEFQDTNALQMRLMDAIHGVRCSVFGGGDGARTPNTERRTPNALFVVGDVQQSIYGFRYADPTIFQALEERFRQGGAGAHVTLADNFRARPEILGLVNYLFRQIWSATGTAFTPLEPGAAYGPKAGPSVECLVARDAGRSLHPAVEAEALAARIGQMVGGREVAITDCASDRRGAAVGYGDIAILMRSLTQIEAYERVFTERGIPYFVVGGGRGYYARHEIRDIMNVLTVLDTPLDDVALAAVLRSPMVGLNTDTLYALALHARSDEQHDRHGPLYPAIRSFLESGAAPQTELAALRAFYDLIHALRRREDRMQAGQLLEEIVVGTEYDAKLLVRPNGRRRLANVRKLLQMANAAGTHGVGDFIRRLRDLERLSEREGDAPTEEEYADVVRIMTIHQAKGLEFPVVFLAGMGKGLGFPERALFVADPKRLAVGCKLGDYQTAAYRAVVEERKAAERAEANRVLYVALTRAREHLVLCGPAQPAGKDTWASMVFGHLAVTVPPAPEVRVGGGGVALRLTPMQGMRDEG